MHNVNSPQPATPTSVLIAKDLAEAKALADSEGSRAVAYLRRIRKMRTLPSEHALEYVKKVALAAIKEGASK